jgi:hypothetical protein
MQHLLVACVGALLLVSVAAECDNGACFNSASLKVDIPRGRSLQQGWGGAVTCESTQLQYGLAPKRQSRHACCGLLHAAEHKHLFKLWNSTSHLISTATSSYTLCAVIATEQ